MRKQILLVLIIMILLVPGCNPGFNGDPLAKAGNGHVFSHEDFSFTIPSGWKTTDEILKKEYMTGKDHYGLGLQTIVTIQHPPKKGKGKAFFSIATSPLAEGETLESRFKQAYETAVPEIKEAVQEDFENDSIQGIKITYRRPWGEPWWNFQDIWLEKDQTIYLLSFHTTPNGVETYGKIYNQILESFQFNN